jgi:hypothetical protein
MFHCRKSHSHCPIVRTNRFVRLLDVLELSYADWRVVNFWIYFSALGYEGLAPHTVALGSVSAGLQCRKFQCQEL